MTTIESKGRFFYKTNRFESIRITNRIDSNRELECSTARYCCIVVIDGRDRPTDGQTDTVPLHRCLPLESASVNNTLHTTYGTQFARRENVQ